MKLYELTTLILWINVLIDENKKLDIDKTIKLIENKEIIEYIKKNYRSIDLSLFKSQEISKINELIYLEFEGYGDKGRINKKLGVTKNGLALIVSLITSYIQNKYGESKINDEEIPTTLTMI